MCTFSIFRRYLASPTPISITYVHNIEDLIGCGTSQIRPSRIEAELKRSELFFVCVEDFPLTLLNFLLLTLTSVDCLGGALDCNLLLVLHTFPLAVRGLFLSPAGLGSVLLCSVLFHRCWYLDDVSFPSRAGVRPDWLVTGGLAPMGRPVRFSCCISLLYRRSSSCRGAAGGRPRTGGI